MERNMRWSCIIILFEIYEFEEHKMVKITQGLWNYYLISLVQGKYSSKYAERKVSQYR